MNKKPKTIVLLDAHAIIHRGYHAFGNLKTSTGKPTGALYGMLVMILSIEERFKPHAIVAAFDRAEKTFRHDAFDGYKGTRKQTDDDLVIQLQEARDICDAFSIPVLDAPGFEADDILGTLVEQLKDNGEYQIVIASGDRDTLQLVINDTVVVYTLKKTINDTIVYDEETVIKNYRFPPTSIPDYKALAGDTSDNISGVRGIGEKTATTLIGKYHTIEELYATLDSNPDEIANLAKARTVTLLTEGRTDAEFSKILATIRTDAPITYTIPQGDWSTQISLEKIRTTCREFEFRSLIPRFEKLFSGEASLFTDSKTETEIIDPKIFRSAQILTWILDSQKIQPSWEEITNRVGVTTPNEVLHKLESEVREKKLEFIWEGIEKPLMPVIESMESRGLLLDTKHLETLRVEFSQELEQIESRIKTVSGKSFLISSPKQLGVVLFEDLGISTKGLRKTKTGGYSTDESTLEKIKDAHPIVPLILQYRERSKILSTYITPLPTYVRSDGRIHPKFNQDGTATGRFSSSEPNIQNLPIRGEIGPRIRNAIIAPDGYTLVKCDYSQIELRVVALLSNDPTMINIFSEGLDIHSGVASKIFNTPQDKVTKDQRRAAKVINFGIIYGMGITALASQLGVSRTEAEEFHTQYFTEFSTLREYFDTSIAQAKKIGYSETLYGRQRNIPELFSKMPQLIAYGERIAMNAPVQGTAADIMKIGMHHAYTTAKNKNADIHLIAQVHDEVLFEIPNALVAESIPLIRESLESVLQKTKPEWNKIPLITDIETGTAWGNTKPFSA